MKQTILIMISLCMLSANSKAEELNIVDVAVNNKQFSTLVKALQAADLVDAVRAGELTVLAPTNDAFEKLLSQNQSLLEPQNKQRLREVLLYHVIPGGGKTLAALLQRDEWATLQEQTVNVRFANGKIRINDATLEAADIVCENGVIHVIDTVLIPPAKEPANLVETAIAAGNFKTLIAAAQAVGLVDALTAEGPLTLFAPTDEAFSKLPEGTVATLLKPENKSRLAAILTYHVLAGKVTAGDALNAREATTLNGAKLKIGFEDGRIRVAGANLVAVDLETGNGLIHVIDQVMMPPEVSKEGSIKQFARRIEEALDQGVPAFNRGDPKLCAQIYMNVSKALAGEIHLPEEAKKALNQSLQRAKHTQGDESRAWALRHGLDRAYKILSQSM